MIPDHVRYTAAVSRNKAFPPTIFSARWMNSTVKTCENRKTAMNSHFVIFGSTDQTVGR